YRATCICVLNLKLFSKALNMYDPQLCYILDGFLGVYGLIITGMFIKEKVGLPGAFTSFISFKKYIKSNQITSILTGLSSATRDTYDSLQMQNLPPR
uniref:Uncharacterized protein n=1 Tax=Amphilophus citrinellus TaxID=61819 RepID=A0A3Q0RPV2_AMPCI